MSKYSRFFLCKKVIWEEINLNSRFPQNILIFPHFFSSSLLIFFFIIYNEFLFCSSMPFRLSFTWFLFFSLAIIIVLVMNVFNHSVLQRNVFVNYGSLHLSLCFCFSWVSFGSPKLVLYVYSNLLFVYVYICCIYVCHALACFIILFIFFSMVALM